MDRITGVQLFTRIVETGSFSKASADLGVTQPTATKHVAAVEARLGARLLNRNTRGVSATEIGALYHEKCKTIQRELEEADSLVSLLQSQVGGQLRVSTSVSFGRRVLTPLVLEFMRSHPDIMIDLTFDDRYVNLVEQGVDVVVRMGRLADASLGARYLGVNPWVLVGSKAYLAAHRAPRPAGRFGAPPLPGLQQRAGRRPLAVRRCEWKPGRQRHCHRQGGARIGAGAGAAALEQAVGAARCGPRRHGPGDPALVGGPRRGGGRQRGAAAHRPRAACAGDGCGVPVAEADSFEGQQLHRVSAGALHTAPVADAALNCWRVGKGPDHPYFGGVVARRTHVLTPSGEPAFSAPGARSYLPPYAGACGFARSLFTPSPRRP